jgi:uncharacterized damage-inducible protein DinB
MPRPELARVPEFYHHYISQVPENELMTAFQNGTAKLLQVFENILPAQQDYRYAEGKWTIKEVLQHIIDAERVFIYRALCFARKDPTPLPGFDENIFAANANAGKRSWNDLIEEFKSVRKSAEQLFASFDEEQLDAGGIASNKPNYVLGFGYIIIGHSLHHTNIIKERYL